MLDKNYSKLINEIKSEIKRYRIKSMSYVNKQLIKFYFEFGRKISIKQKEFNWGEGFIEKLANDLKEEGIKGFSKTTIKMTRIFYETYKEDQIGQQLVDQIPWSHNKEIWDKGLEIGERTNFQPFFLFFQYLTNKFIKKVAIIKLVSLN